MAARLSNRMKLAKDSEGKATTVKGPVDSSSSTEDKFDNEFSSSVNPKQRVEPLPKYVILNGPAKRKEWKRKYGKTHNPDGTPK